jgi:hypothetical protein
MDDSSSLTPRPEEQIEMLRLEMRHYNDEMIKAIRDRHATLLRAFCNMAQTTDARLASVENLP